MLITKRTLIESVIKEVEIEDVLSGQHYVDSKDEVNDKYWNEGLRKFWGQMYELTEFLQGGDENVDKIVDYMNTVHKSGELQINDDLREFTKNFVRSNNAFKWIKSKLDPWEVRKTLERYEFTPDLSDNVMMHIAELEFFYHLNIFYHHTVNYH